MVQAVIPSHVKYTGVSATGGKHRQEVNPATGRRDAASVAASNIIDNGYRWNQMSGWYKPGVSLTDAPVTPDVLGGEDDGGRKPGGYYGPNYTAQRNALKAAAERQAPILLQQYSSQLGDLINNNQFYADEAQAAKDVANRDKLQADINQRMIAEDLWYFNQQKDNNMALNHFNNMNVAQGSIRDSYNHLLKLVDDQQDETVINNLKQGLLGNNQQHISTMNSIETGLAENNQQVYNQIQDLFRQGSSNITNYVSEILGQLAAYDDRQLQTADGNLTQAGWDWLKQFGIENDGTGKYKFNYNIFGNNGMSNEDFESYLQRLQSSRPKLLSVDNMGMVRSIDKTNDFLRGQNPRNRSELGKASNIAANQVYYGNKQVQRYG